MSSATALAAALPSTSDDARETTVIEAVIGGEKVQYYASQQETINYRLSDGVKDCEKAGVAAVAEMCSTLRDILATRDATLNQREERLREYSMSYVWPFVPAVTTEFLVAENKLQLTAAELQRLKLPDITGLEKEAVAALTTLETPVNLRRHIMDAEASINKATGALMQDETTAHSCVVPLHDQAFADVLNYIHREVAQTDNQLTLLSNELDRVSRLKQDALTTEDIVILETASFSELDLLEKIIAQQVKRIEIVMPAGTDVQTYRHGAAKAIEKLSAAINKQREFVRERAQTVTQDSTKIADAAKAAIDQHEAAKQVYAAQLQKVSTDLTSNSKRRKEIWKAIDALLTEAQTVTEDHQRLALEKSQMIATELKRRAEYDAYVRGIVAIQGELKAQQQLAVSADKIITSEANFLTKLSKLMEDRPLEAEAKELRTSEGRRHLNYYSDFQDRMTDLLHRKETRAFALNRSIRTLQLQIKEAVVTLDPHKQRYAEESAVAESEVQKVNEQVAALKQREAVQRQHWDPTELLLESEGVDFDPPELKTSATRCSRKEQSLKEARKFVSTEQEVVDKDALALRKLKMRAQVAKDVYDQRRTPALEDASGSPDTSPQKRPPAPAAPAASTAVAAAK